MKNNRDFWNKEESKWKKNRKKESKTWPCKIKRKNRNINTKDQKRKPNSKMPDKKIKKPFMNLLKSSKLVNKKSKNVAFSFSNKNTAMPKKLD